MNTLATLGIEIDELEFGIRAQLKIGPLGNHQ